MVVESPLIFLTFFAIMLLAGILSSLLSKYLKISNILFLILIGIGMRMVGVVEFPTLFLTSMAILALVMIVFDSSSRFKIAEFDIYSANVLKLTLIFLFLNLIFLTGTTILVDRSINFWYALMFAALMAGTDPATIMVMFKDVKSRVGEFLEVESIINTPIIVLLPFIFLDLMNSIETTIWSGFISQVVPFLQQIITGIGTGIVMGIIVFKIMSKKYSATLSPIAIITAALFAYILAENLGGNGVLSVTVMGLFYSTITLKKKAQLMEFSSFFTNFLEIIVFILIGLIILFPITTDFILKSLFLFISYLLIRFAAIWISVGKDFNWKQKLLMSISVQKGIAVSVVVLTLSTLALPGIEPILNLSLAFVIYSIILSTIMTKISKPIFHKHFLHESELKKMKKAMKA